MMLPFGAGTGSAQVCTLSWARAAGLLLISTLPLPAITVPELVGGFWKVPFGGTCGGLFVAVLPTTAANWPSIMTFWLQPPVMVPANGSGVGVGTGPPGLGT